ncbi:MAG: hypothetical protein FWH27_04725 [Planctomycetaceae bacterium]|nr:hypothetical protein [Planctomycetaceae bacterium]
MSRKNRSSPISFFSFQDIMMCVCGLLIMVSLLLTLNLVNKDFGIPANEKKTTPEMFDDMLRQIAELESAVGSLERELTARTAVADANAFLNEEEILERITSLETEIVMLKADVERNDAVIAQSDREHERLRELSVAIARLNTNIETVEQNIKHFDQRNSELTENTFFISNRHDSALKPWLVVCNANDISVISPDTGKSQTHTRASFPDWAKTRPKDREYFVFYVRPSAVGYYEPLLNLLQRQGYKTGLDLIGEMTSVRIVADENEVL